MTAPLEKSWEFQILLLLSILSIYCLGLSYNNAVMQMRVPGTLISRFNLIKDSRQTVLSFFVFFFFILIT